jgi:thioredoxin reductase (NADPH)
MFDYDAVVIGAGPAGLTAGIYLARARYRVWVLEKGQFGEQLKNVEWIENYSGFAGGIGGPQLASAMIYQAVRYGEELEEGEVTGIESFSSCRSIFCAEGKSYTSLVVIAASGSRSKRLAIPDEDVFQTKGMIHCAPCDGSQFADRVAVICGGGNTGVTEALSLAKLASKVIIIEAQQAFTVTAILQERVRANPKVEIRCGERVLGIRGDQWVKNIDLVHGTTGRKEAVGVDGILVHVGIEPNTECLSDAVPLNDQRQIVVNNRLETDSPCIFAAGDIRVGSPRQIATAVGDGAAAAITAQQTLQTILEDNMA